MRVDGVSYGLIAVTLAGAAATAQAVDVGARAPEIGLEDARGNRIRMARYRGKVVVVDIWASWCEPCREELPALQRLYARHFRRGLRVVGVNVDEDASAMRRFVDSHRVLFPNVHDRSRQVARRWGLSTMPTSFVVGPRGIVRHVNRGYRSGDDRRLERVVERLLGEAEPATREAEPATREAEPEAEVEDTADGDGEVPPAAGAPPEVAPSEAGRSGGLCSTTGGGGEGGWLLLALLVCPRAARPGRRTSPARRRRRPG